MLQPIGSAASTRDAGLWRLRIGANQVRVLGAIVSLLLIAGLLIFLYGDQVGSAPNHIAELGRKPNAEAIPGSTELQARGLPASKSRDTTPRGAENPGVVNAGAFPLVADEFQMLASRASNGDAIAACELSAALDLCGRTAWYDRRISQLETQIASSDRAISEPALDLIATMEADRARGRQTCQGLSREQIASAWKYMVMAADLGNERAALQFLLNPPLDSRNFLQDLEGWTVYRDRYDEILQRLVDRGNLEAASYLYGLYSGENSAPYFESPPVLPDFYRATVLALVLSQMSDKTLQRYYDLNTLSKAVERLGVDGYQRAQNEARLLRASKFQNSEFEQSASEWDRPDLAMRRDECAGNVRHSR
jgi:hypothetical protein